MRLIRYLRCLLYHGPAWRLIHIGAEWEEWACNKCGWRWFQHRG